MRGKFNFLYVDIWLDVTKCKFNVRDSSFEMLVVFSPIFVADTKITFVYGCVRQNKVIERIIEHYWYLLYQKASDTSWKLATQFVLLICIAINHYCQMLINFVNQNMTESSASSGLGGMSGGRGQYCCVPECRSARYGRWGNKTRIGLFKFPSREKKPRKYQSWVKAISMYRRRGGRDTFDPYSKNAVICEYHFKEEHLKKAADNTKKTYTEDTVPSIFILKSLTRPNEKPISKRPAPR